MNIGQKRILKASTVLKQESSINRKLLCILAHPDDESLGTGGSIAKYAAEGVDVQLICATRGERGRYFEQDSPGLIKVGQKRTEELQAASSILGISKVHFLDYLDGDLDAAPVNEVVSKIKSIILDFRPQIIVTFGPDGGYGHPDHIAISQYSLSAIVQAATNYKVLKLYYLAWPKNHWELYVQAFKKLQMTVDGELRESAPWPEWAITTRIDTNQHWETVWKAIQCHETQIPGYKNLSTLSPEQHRELWGTQEFYRVFSLINSGRDIEFDLFEGISPQHLLE